MLVERSTKKEVNQKVCLLIHGYLTDSEDFQDLPLLLKSKKIYDQVINFVIPGHQGENHEEFTLEKVIAKVDNVMTELIKNQCKIDIIGFSLGGALAKYIACKYDIHKVILLAPAVRHMSPKSIFRRFNYLFDQKNKSHQNEFKNLLNEDIYATTFFFKKFGEKFTIRSYHVFRSILHYIDKFGGEIRCPMLIIWGYFDELVPKIACNICMDACTSLEKTMIVIPNIGHIMLRSCRKKC